jgi:hypothetical protein
MLAVTAYPPSLSARIAPAPTGNSLSNILCHMPVFFLRNHHRPPVLGLKAVPSNNLGTLAWSLRADASATGPQQQQLQQQQPLQQPQQQQQQPGDGLSASSQASGLYVFYEDPNGLMVGTTRRAPAGAASFTKMQDCMSACDDDPA